MADSTDTENLSPEHIIRRNVLFLVVAITGITTLAVGFVSFQVYFQVLLEKKIEILGVESVKSASQIEMSLEQLKSDVLFLADTPPISGINRALNNNGYDALGKSSLEDWKTRLKAIFTRILTTRENYIQVRLILADDLGREFIRVERDRLGTIRVVSEDHLQSKAGEQYFKETIKRKDGDVYISDFNLNREQGRIQIPYLPVLRAGTPVYAEDGSLFALVVINEDAVPFLDRFRETHAETNGFILTADGHYLIHPNHERSFQIIPGRDASFAEDYPEIYKSLQEVAHDETRGLLNGFVSRDEQGVEQVFNFAFVPLDSQDPERRVFVVTQSSTEPIRKIMSRLAMQVALLSLGILLCALIAGVLFARRITRPLAQLHHAILSYTESDHLKTLPTDEPGEVGSLARAFARMAETRNRESAERKRVELKLRALNDELLRSNQDLENFAYVASHDLKSPLSGIAKLARMIEEDDGDKLSESSKRLLDLLRNRVSRLTTLLDCLLEYARFSMLKDSISEFSTQELVNEVIELIEVPEHFTIEVDSQLPVIRSSRPAMQKVFLNLISNAIKHHDRKHGIINISVQKNNRSQTEFLVSDDGPGIAEIYHDKIFEIFQKLDSRDEVEGSGMGLAIVRRAVEKLGGEIEVLSNNPRGTIFKVTIPDYNKDIQDE